MPIAYCLLPIFTRKFILHDCLTAVDLKKAIMTDNSFLEL
ncbi:hypothetical protein BH695_1697 [Microcystis aeruginosa PCC 7806SL]|uniref:Uncharacterized protein n=1 Tax=Microcystis aeruginosa PCC 7806SL TaxID=1903187 RepID=A0AB33BZG6_MICA7|nr:hypothetical protein BH695_1697 [Microcystis aeruginosa PCC 7806SL]